MYEALDAYIRLGAFAGREEHIKGRLRPGMLGDFAVLDTDIFTCPSERIHEIGVVATYVAGQAVHGGL